MGRVLVLGGTAWLGREIAGELLAQGDQVTCLARGSAGRAPVGARLVRADRSDPDAYAGVAGQVWDDVIELSYDPAFVAAALAALSTSARHWTLISSVSVYATNSEPGADESPKLLDPVDLEEYGQAKVAAERASLDVVGDRLLIARPGLIAGPGDGSDRFGYWVARFALARDGQVLTPVPDGRAVQVIDVQDLAAWISQGGRRGVTGMFNATGDEHALADVLTAAADVAGFTGDMVSAPDAWLVDNDVRYWAGPRSLPLWVPASDIAVAQRDNTAFTAAGGTLSALRHTLARILADERARGLDRVRRSGLTREEELDLLHRWPPSHSAQPPTDTASSPAADCAGRPGRTAGRRRRS